jgi:hypothetical protein
LPASAIDWAITILLLVLPQIWRATSGVILVVDGSLS